jgi:hypothetical protein
VLWKYVHWTELALLRVLFSSAPRHEGVLGEWRYSYTHSLTSALDGGEWSASRPGRFTPRERASGTHWVLISNVKLVTCLRWSYGKGKVNLPLWLDCTLWQLASLPVDLLSSVGRNPWWEAGLMPELL